MLAEGDFAGKVRMAHSERFAWRFWDESVVFYDEWSGETVLLGGAVSFVLGVVSAANDAGGVEMSSLAEQLAAELEQPVDERIRAGITHAVAQLSEFELVRLEHA